MYTLNYLVTTSTCGEDGRLKLYSAVQMMQDCSELWAVCEPDIKEFFSEGNIAQMMVTRIVDILRVPSFGERLKVVSSMHGTKAHCGYRNTRIFDADGQRCYDSWSKVVFVDKETGRLTRLPDDILVTQNREPAQEAESLDRKPAAPRCPFAALPSFKAQRNDIDYNHHVNNASFIRMAAELLPEDYRYNHLRVEYKSPVRLNEDITPQVASDGDTFRLRLNTAETTAVIMAFSTMEKNCQSTNH